MARKSKYGAVFARDSETIVFLGYGYLQEPKVPKGGKGTVCGVYERLGIKTPVLKMDDGTKLYGCQCTEFTLKKELDQEMKQKQVIKKKPADVFESWPESNLEDDILKTGCLFTESQQ